MQFMLFKYTYYIFILSLFTACTSTKMVSKSEVSSQIELEIIKRLDSLSVNYGFVIKERGASNTIAEKNANHRFDPASNVKIFTLLGAVNLLNDSLLTFKYKDDNNARHLLPMGDPSFLHPQFEQGTALERLKSGPDTLIVYFPEKKPSSFGPGWAWDDYLYKFSSERSILPVFGNCVNISKGIGDKLIVHPRNIEVEIVEKEAIEHLCFREEDINKFYLRNTWSGHNMLSVPFIWSETLVLQILADYTGKIIQKGEERRDISWFTNEIKNMERDTILKSMFKKSDNFLAEQLMVNIGMQEWGSSEQVIPYLRETVFPGGWTDYKFVDGSGLSNYNNATPLTIVRLLEMLDKTSEEIDLLTYFPIAGEEGSLSTWRKEETPFYFVKTGKKTGVRTLSGFVDSVDQKRYTFSIMIQGYYGSSRELDIKLRDILELMYKEL